MIPYVLHLYTFHGLLYGNGSIHVKLFWVGNLILLHILIKLVFSTQVFSIALLCYGQGSHVLCGCHMHAQIGSSYTTMYKDPMPL